MPTNRERFIVELKAQILEEIITGEERFFTAADTQARIERVMERIDGGAIVFRYPTALKNACDALGIKVKELHAYCAEASDANE